MPARRARAPRPSRRRPTPAFVLRRARAADLPLLVDHRHRMWIDIGGRLRRDVNRSDAVYRRWIRARLAAHEAVGWIAVAPGGRPIGSGVVWLTPTQPRPGRIGRKGRMPYIMTMYTDPAARGQGVATAIVRAMIAWARQHDYARIFLHASRQGRPVYERIGFVAANELRLDLPARRRPHGH